MRSWKMRASVKRPLDTGRGSDLLRAKPRRLRVISQPDDARGDAFSFLLALLANFNSQQDVIRGYRLGIVADAR